MSDTTTQRRAGPTRHRNAPGQRRPRTNPAVLAAIAAGGALGAPARYGIAQLVPVSAGSFPWATFTINVTGSFALGVALMLILDRFPPTRYVRPFLATGFLGAYTTYSTFAVEGIMLVHDGHPATALTYTASTLAAGLTAVRAGVSVARLIPLPTRTRP